MLGGLFALPLSGTDLGKHYSRASKLIEAARSQIGVTLQYVPSYRSLDYPMGDFTRAEGVCTDVVVRAYRDAFTFDLQKALHTDMSARFSEYPEIWGLSRADKNIDHRRVPNLETWLKDKGYERPVPTKLRDWQAGDLFSMRLGGRLPHIAIVSSTRDAASTPLVIHNIGRGTREEGLLGGQPNTRRFQFLPTDSNIG